MEILEEKIKLFLSSINSSRYDYGFCDGSGSGFGYGFCDGSGSGFGYGFCDGSGSGEGFCNGSGSGSGSICGDGCGDSSGDGDGYGYSSECCNKIRTINSHKVYLIDKVPTIIMNINKNIAKGYILKYDLDLVSCYIAKNQNKYAHGKTIAEARKALELKIYNEMNTEDIIKEFTQKFKKETKYKASDFYLWHNLLTGSCEMGRKNFIEKHGINLEDTYTVEEFIELTKNDYGGTIITKLKEYY